MVLVSTGQTLRASFAFFEVDPTPYVDVMENYFLCPRSNSRRGVHVEAHGEEYTVYCQEFREEEMVYRCEHPIRGWVFLYVR